MDREGIDFEEFTVAARNTKNRVDRTVVVNGKVHQGHRTQRYQKYITVCTCG
ncbi:MAG: hypothetical protein HXS48_19525 [Theionarchaea archaeon]|nr:hypothetical protein [Theionarchaea archaeon]